ncbi:MAG TPA: ABC transporter permease [Acetobacteraceae bacterium]|nr:ABC transporter permease [Acetobacteraceae bacterium]
MAQQILRRLGWMLVTMLAASLLLFLLFELLPGDVALSELGPYSTPEQRALWLVANGYDRPAVVRYFDWLGHFLIGQWGQSRLFMQPVARIAWARLENTAILGFWFFAFLIPLSLGMGVLAGMKERSWLDRAVSAVCILTTSIPPFASTVLVSAVFVYGLHWLPGTSTMLDGFSYRQLVMPVMVLVLYDFGYIARITRTAMAEVMETPYIRAAILRGLPHRRVILRHALRNALIAPFTLLMLHVNWLIAGVIVVEYFFAFKGFGSLILEASLGKDLYLLEACTMITVAIATITQTVSDLGYLALNPRMRPA